MTVSEKTAVLMGHYETVLPRSPKFELWRCALSDREHQSQFQKPWLLDAIGCSIRGSRGSVAFLCKHTTIYS